MTLRVLILVGVAPLAFGQQPDGSEWELDSAEADADENAPTTTQQRMEALTRLVRRIGWRARPEVVLHLFDPEAPMRAHAAQLLAALGDPDGLARDRLAALAKGGGVDADAARAAVSALYAMATPAALEPRWPELSHPALEPALPGDAELLSPGTDGPSIIPPFDAATTTGRFRVSMDLQVGTQVAETALRLGLHPRIDLGLRLLFHPEDLWGPQIRFWHPVSPMLHVLVSATPYVLGLFGDGDYHYDAASGSYVERSREGFGAVGTTATLGGRGTRLVLSAELRGPQDQFHGVLSAGFEVPLISKMLKLKIAVTQLWSEYQTDWGPLLGLDSVF